MENKKINDILKDNQELFLSIEENDILKNEITGMLLNIESIIPEECRQNLYNNLSTLKFNLSKNEIGDSALAGYDPKENIVYINPDYFNILKDISGIDENDERIRAFLETIYHELLHMASTTREEKSNYYCSGYVDKTENEKGELEYEREYESLTEAFTEFLTNLTFKKRAYSSYGEFVNILGNISNLVGLDEMKRAYFNNRNGMKIINKKLDALDKNSNHQILFDMIDSSYYSYIGSEYATNEPSLLFGIESKLLDMSNNKLEKERAEKSYSKDDIIKYWNRVREYINFPEVLEERGKDLSKYDGIEKIREVYLKFKNSSLENVKSSFKKDLEGQVNDQVTIDENTSSKNQIGKISKDDLVI